MSDSVWNKLTLDETAVMTQIKRHLIKTLRDAEKRLLDIMESEVLKTVYKGAPGKPEWREELKDSLRVLEEEITDEYMRADVGADVRPYTYQFVRAMLITYGGGSRAYKGKRIKAGPKGRQVWTSDLDGMQPSRAESVYFLPKEFNQKGNQFVRNAAKLMQKYFKDILDEAVMTLPSSVFFGNVHVTERK